MNRYLDVGETDYGVRLVHTDGTFHGLLSLTGTQQSLSDAGAVNVTSFATKWTTTGAAAGTLADGSISGQLKLVTLIVDGGDGTLTITTAESASLNVITFADVGDTALLMWTGTFWKILWTGNIASGDAGPAIS